MYSYLLYIWLGFDFDEIWWSTKASMGGSIHYCCPFNQQIAILCYQHEISLWRVGS